MEVQHHPLDWHLQFKLENRSLRAGSTSSVTTGPPGEEDGVAGRPRGQQPPSCTLHLAGCRRLACHFVVRAKVGLRDTREFGSRPGNRWMNLVHLLMNVTSEQRGDLHRLALHGPLTSKNKYTRQASRKFAKGLFALFRWNLIWWFEIWFDCVLKTKELEMLTL